MGDSLMLETLGIKIHFGTDQFFRTLKLSVWWPENALNVYTKIVCAGSC